MVTSSFSLDTSVVNGAYKDRHSTCIATVEAGALEQRVSAPRAGCLLDSIWSLLVLTVLFSLLYYRLYLRSEAGPGQETKGVSQRSLFTATMAFIVCVCLCKSFERIFCAVCMVNGSRGAKKQWYKDALQTSFTGKAGNNDIHSYLCPPPFYTRSSSKILGRTFLTRIYMTTASLS